MYSLHGVKGSRRLAIVLYPRRVMRLARRTALRDALDFGFPPRLFAAPPSRVIAILVPMAAVERINDSTARSFVDMNILH